MHTLNINKDVDDVHLRPFCGRNWVKLISIVNKNIIGLHLELIPLFGMFLPPCFNILLYKKRFKNSKNSIIYLIIWRSIILRNYIYPTHGVCGCKILRKCMWFFYSLLREKVESNINMLDNIYKNTLVILFDSNVNIMISKSKDNNNIYNACL